MKKILLCLITAIVLSNCEVSVKKTSAQDMINIACDDGYCVTYEKVIIDNMEFGVFSATHPYGMAPFIVNLTKDKLEIELLKRQLSK